MAIELRCDRCEQKIASSESGIPVGLAESMRVRISEEGYKSTRIELCEKCRKELEEWLKAGKT